MFGIEIFNDINYTQISTNSRAVRKLYEEIGASSSKGKGDHRGYDPVWPFMYPTPIREEVPPLIFVRNHPEFIHTFSHIGKPGEWVGFAVMIKIPVSGDPSRQYYFPNVNTILKLDYIVASDNWNVAHRDFGMEVYDYDSAGNRETIFNSNYELVDIDGQSENFKSAGRLSHTRLWYTLPKPRNDAYVLLQNIGLISDQGNGHVRVDMRDEGHQIRILVNSNYRSGWVWYEYNPFLMLFALPS